MNASNTSLHTIFGIDALAGSWKSRSPRERLLLRLAAVLIFVSLISLMVDWIGSERQRLKRSLPRSEAQLRQIQVAAAELAELRRTEAMPALSVADLAKKIVDSAKARGLDLTVAADGEMLRVSGRVPFDVLVEWVAGTHKESGVRIQKLDVQRESDVAVVSATLVSSLAQ